jgi:LacI family transcriptional regulator
MSDVAELAGVSKTTVSHVINETRFVEEETKRRVQEAIEELDYRPSMVARGLALRQTRTIGLIVTDITNPFFAKVARGVLDTAQDRGYDVFLCNSDMRPREEIRALYSLADHGVDGAIIFLPAWGDLEKLETFAKQYPPLVLVNRSLAEHPGISLVMADIEKGATLAIDHLVSKGHTAIGMLAGRWNPTAGVDELKRVQGFRAALAAHGIAVVEDWILPGQPTRDFGYKATLQLLTQYPQITAIFGYNDLLAVGAIQACTELGRRVPDDCAVTGFDDIELAALVTPPLTTIRMHKYELGYQAATRLLEMLADPDGDYPPICMDVELVIRQST